MSAAPANLLEVRHVFRQYLGPTATPRKGVTILDPLGDPVWEIGIVADTAHSGGYHCGSDRVVPNDYSVVESSRDRAGLALYASALDVGEFAVRTPLGYFDLRHYSRWLVMQCAANTADTQDIREVIYSPDGTTVKRWDRLDRRTTGDTSHRKHTHQSYFRDATKSGKSQTRVVLRYLQTIGVIEGTDMALTNDDLRKIGLTVATWDYRNGEEREEAYKVALRAANNAEGANKRIADVSAKLDALLATPPGAVVISDEQLERVLRKVIGSVDENA